MGFLGAIEWVWRMGFLGSSKCDRMGSLESKSVSGFAISLLSLSVSLFAHGPEMARRSWWSVTGFDEGGFERLELCDRLAPMRSSCILALTRRSSCSFSLSFSLLFSKAGNHLKWKWKRKSFSTVLAIFYGQPGNTFQFDQIWSNNQTPTFPENHFRNHFEAKTNGALATS